MKRWARIWLAVLVAVGMCWALTASSSARGTTQDAWKSLVSNDGTYQLRWKSEPAAIEFGQRFSVSVQASRLDGTPFQADLALDARMPKHGHGMNREPQVKALGAGKFELQGLLFHMPGYWEIYFDLTRGAITERAQTAITID